MTPVTSQPILIRFILVRVLVTVALMIQAVALGWFVYAKTGSALSLVARVIQTEGTVSSA